jgi:hypothetical protein
MRKLVLALSALIAGIALPAGTAFAGPGLPTAVPEPASLALLAGGIGALALIKFSRRR